MINWLFWLLSNLVKFFSDVLESHYGNCSKCCGDNYAHLRRLTFRTFQIRQWHFAFFSAIVFCQLSDKLGGNFQEFCLINSVFFVCVTWWKKWQLFFMQPVSWKLQAYFFVAVLITSKRLLYQSCIDFSETLPKHSCNFRRSDEKSPRFQLFDRLAFFVASKNYNVELLQSILPCSHRCTLQDLLDSQFVMRILSLKALRDCNNC